MGQSLSAESTTGDFQIEFLGACWAVAWYGIGMVWCAMTLTDRWQEPFAHADIGLGDWIWAFFLSTAWPFVFLALAMSPKKVL